jgi:hypothetical protein
MVKRKLRRFNLARKAARCATAARIKGRLQHLAEYRKLEQFWFE